MPISAPSWRGGACSVSRRGGSGGVACARLRIRSGCGAGVPAGRGAGVDGRGARRRRHLGVDEHVVHDFARARHDLHRLDPLVFGEVRRNLEVLILDRAGRGNGELLRHRDDRVRRAHRPARRDTPGFGGSLFRSPGFAPASIQRRIVCWSASDRRRSLRKTPCGPSACHGGIMPARDRVAHLVDLRLRAVVVEQRERPQAARMMARRAVPVEDRRNVFGECRIRVPRRE